jgi:hypothetical protein
MGSYLPSEKSHKIEGEWLFITYFPKLCKQKGPEFQRIKYLHDRGLS